MSVPARPPATRLGDMPVTRFLQRHWQRRPLVIRQAELSEVVAILDRAFGLLED